MKKESRILHIYGSSSDNLRNVYIFTVFRGSTGIEYMDIIEEERLDKALEMFSRKDVFKEIKYYFISEKLSSYEKLEKLREILGRSGLREISREELLKMKIFEEDFEKVLDKILLFCERKSYIAG
ncbi:MAG: hypothetical protein QXJ51_06405 [Sulfolobales archaeon]